MADSLGETLLKARLQRGETLDQISLELHIRTRYLEALECDEFAILPSEVQGKGFLRMYAGYLGLTVQPLLMRWGIKSTNSGLPPSTTPPIESITPVVEDLAPGTEEEKEAPTEPLPLLNEAAYDEPVELPEPESQPYEEKIIPPSSAEILVQIGIMLRQRREHLNLSLADVERHTHVRQRYLAALEEGRMESLPSTVQGRGMLNNYASFLELDSDAMLLKFAEALQTRRIETVVPAAEKRPTGKRKPAKVAPTWRRLITPDLLFGSGLILVLFVFAVWTASQVNSLQSQNEAATPPSIFNMLLQTGSPVATVSVAPTQRPNLGTRIPDTGGAVAPADTETPAATITLVPGGTGPLQVAIVASMSTYMRITIDGKVAFDGRALPGNAYPFSGTKRIELLTGNAAALQVFFNQVDLGNLGLVGEVKTLIFSKDGVVTPTVMFTPTSTRTQPPTATQLPSPTVPTRTITPYVP
jgi:cytoskeleton protein RodZ